MHEQMMAEMKANDATLDALVAHMNATAGSAKVDAIAAVVSELVRQQKAMHQHMGQMRAQMMGRDMMGRGGMMRGQ
jgi:outer membrane murein-binding lipoprotein Lpp